MGSSQSSHARSASDDKGGMSSNKGGQKLSGARGLTKKIATKTGVEENEVTAVATSPVDEAPVLVEEPALMSCDSDVDTEDDDDDDMSVEEEDEYPSDEEEDDEDEEDILERMRILEDARRLKNLAEAFLHPEKSVKVDPTATARCYFDRPSAPEQESPEEADERAQILADAEQLRKAARDYLHPEVGVSAGKVDPTVFGRNYFDRPTAPEQESPEEANERAQIMSDAAALKKLAVDYAHPEVGVRTTDPTVFGRNYFNRPSAPDAEETGERARVLADAAALKKLATGFAHPEVGVRATDPALFGRNYFDRPSAPEIELEEEAEECARVLSEAAAFKKLAVAYAHPEVGVKTTDPTVYGRNYFNRPSAPEVESHEEADERAQVLTDAAALKKLAADYAHPEVGVVASDPTAFGRNYFYRGSAPDAEPHEEAEERARILAEASAFKQLAVEYAHPEIGVRTTDPTVFGRNYYDRPSAQETETQEEAEERAQILSEAAALKKLTVDFAHPEISVNVMDPTVFGRNYFNRPSAPDTVTREENEERAQILAEAAALKKLAIDYSHPQVGVKETDPTVFGRNYFNRPSAPDTETQEEAEERARILAEAAALKKLAVDYSHPELSVNVTDPTVFGRNYFNKLSADDTESQEVAEERAQVLAEAAALKKSAVDYAHPEFGVKVTDPTVFGRNYFNRPSAPETENPEEAEERAQILADAASLKEAAIRYAHPEVGVKTTDPAAFGRNYYSRPSAPDVESPEESEARACIFSDAAALKKLAADYAHPEVGVKTTDPTVFGRNYFNRPSGHGHEDEIATHATHTMSTEYAHYTEHAETMSHDHSYDHFDMDEDMYHDMREQFKAIVHECDHCEAPLEDKNGEGNLSRSPSSVMLFGLDEPAQQQSGTAH